MASLDGKRNRGRPKAIGRVFYLGRFRFVPGVHPPELEGLLEAIETAGQGRHQALLEAALVGGLSRGQAAAAQVEDDETTAILDAMLAEFEA